MTQSRRIPKPELPGTATARDGYVEIVLEEALLCSKAHDECVAAVKAAAKRFRAKRLMLVCDNHDNVSSLTDAYAIGTKVATEGRGLRLCIVLTGRSVKAIDHFAETVASNRGGALRYFDDREAARRWLLSTR
ncbi:MAG TPA: hypothetical protein VN598_03990 [Usitatibacter sp.]|nr:hypothetical protein [Usitatibacter sp.]